MADGLGLSRPTVRAALMYLVNHGLIERRRGSGTVVIREKVNRNLQLTSLFDDLTESGKHPGSRVLRNEVVPASEAVAEHLGLALGEPVVRLERLRTADDAPIALMHNQLPARYGPFDNDELVAHGLYELLRRQGVRVSTATQRMSARTATPHEAALLEDKRGAALVTMERVARDQFGVAVELGEHVYRASRYVFQATLNLSDDSMTTEHSSIGQ